MPIPLKPEQLRRSYDAGKEEYETTAELKPASSIIGQPRGVQAIEFGLNMKMNGYNIFVLGASGTGRTTAIQQYVEDRAAQRSRTLRLGLRPQLHRIGQTGGYPTACRQSQLFPRCLGPGDPPAARRNRPRF